MMCTFLREIRLSQGDRFLRIKIYYKILKSPTRIIGRRKEEGFNKKDVISNVSMTKVFDDESYTKATSPFQFLWNVWTSKSYR